MSKRKTPVFPDKKVSEMKISDVLQTQTFFDVADAELKAIWKSRQDYKRKFEAKGRKAPSHPIDRLHSEGKLETGAVIVYYAQILDKKATDLSASQRDIITEYGNIAFHKAMRILIELEENETT